MGAKFIADVELMSHDQCLRLCCETEGCNVFVYEEKVRKKPKVAKFEPSAMGKILQEVQ